MTAPTRWTDLRRYTSARVALGRAGNGLPTAAHLAFQADHAAARDAVHAALDVEALLADLGRPASVVRSAAPDRATYLLRPDLGRSLHPECQLEPQPGCIAVVIADGLSATAAQRHAAGLVALLGHHGPIVIATQARVALGDAIGAALQAEQAKIAIGAGGLTGVGLGDGRQKLGFLPEIHSDFIFANIGEELGLVATLSVVLAFFLIAVCGLYIAYRARDQFGCLLVVGVTTLICYQAIFNLFVVTSLLPNKGLALPFISAGGSSLLAMMIGVGMLLSVARQAEPAKIAAAEIVTNDNPFAAKAA